MWSALIIAAVTVVLISVGVEWLADFRQGGYDAARADEAQRDLETARKQDEVLSAMRAANEQDGDFDDDPFRER